MKTILLDVADSSRVSYGIVYVSKTLHRITGPGVHNREFNHEIQCWVNRLDADGRLVDPSGRPTGNEISWYTSAQASVLALHPVNVPTIGEPLVIGEEIRLAVQNDHRVLGHFIVTARMCADPILERI